MGVLRKVALLALVVAVAAVVWQWMNYVDIQDFYKNKRIILTGASKGIGKSLAIQLAQLGAKLVIAARSADKLAETQRECQRYTSEVYTVVADVSREEDCKAIVDKAADSLGGVDILIPNAAYSYTPGWFVDYDKPEDIFQKVFAVNVWQNVNLVHYSLPYLNTSHGIIVPVSSGSAIVGTPMVSAYSASKHAIHGFYKVLNQELIMTDTPISITVMPLPYVLTDKAVENWKPMGNDGITPEVSML